MANPLTGDFDLVAQFAVPAVNRFLAAMHRIERFSHSLAFYVDDTPPVGPRDRPPIVEIIDTLGDPVVDPRSVRVPAAIVEAFGDAASGHSRFDGITNVDALGIHLPPITPSNLKGRLQLQVSPPTVEIADSVGTKIRVRMQVMSRYFADPGTSAAAEFVRGELQLTAAVAEVASQVANIVDIDVKAEEVGITFVPQWSSTPLTFEDLAGIHLLIRNALRKSLLPSNITLPANVRVRFRTLIGTQPAVAMLLNMSGVSGDPATAQNVFLAGNDDFALAAGIDFIRAQFAGTVDAILAHPIPAQEKYGVTYNFTLNNVAVDLETNRIVLTITGRATTPNWLLPNFDFTLRQKFQLVPARDSATLTLAEMSLSTTSTLINAVEFLLIDTIAAVRDQALSESGAVDAVRDALSATRRLGPVLRPLLTPARPKPGGVSVDQFSLAYTAVAIQPAGIVLRGTLTVSEWPAPVIEFEEVTPSAPSLSATPAGAEYSALKTWIPGGTIDSYEWLRLGQTQPTIIDDHTFIRLPPDPTTSDGGSRGMGAFRPLCLTVRGTRLSASGAVAAQPVVATSCAFDWFPLFGRSLSDAVAPLVTLTRPGRDGLVAVEGHVAAVDPSGRAALPNLIVHFGTVESAAQLQRATDALRESGRVDAQTAVVAVLSAEDLPRVRYTPGVVYAEHQDGAWHRLLRTERSGSPTTLVVDPRGNVVSRHEGELDAASLSADLRRTLVRTNAVKVTSVRSSARVGHLPPNFVFNVAPQHQLALRKLIGRPVALVFWRAASVASIEAARTMASRAVAEGTVILAINDGDPKELATEVANRSGFAERLVVDTHRRISMAYGVTAWPTAVLIDQRGVVSAVHSGHSGGGGTDGVFQKRPAGTR